VVLGDGTLAIAGWTTSAGAGGEDGWLLRLSADGAVLGERTYGAAQDDFFDAVALLPGGDLALAGSTRSQGAGARDAWVVVAAPDGAPRREHAYGSPADELIKDVAAADDGRTLLLGSVKDGLTEGLAIFVDPAGAQTELRRFDELRRSLRGGAATSDGGWILTGDYATMNSNYGNAWLLKLDREGKGPTR
jgi:hypothetical protein